MDEGDDVLLTERTPETRKATRVYNKNFSDYVRYQTQGNSGGMTLHKRNSLSSVEHMSGASSRFNLGQPDPKIDQLKGARRSLRLPEWTGNAESANWKQLTNQSSGNVP